jgi:glucokinase
LNSRPENFHLVSDIGGTRVRFGLAGEQDRVQHLREFKTSDFSGFTACAEAYLVQLSANVSRPEAAAIAVAGPIEDGVARLTNVSWTIDAAEIKAALGLKSVRLANDFEAQAYALPWLDPEDLQQVGGGKVIPNGSRVVLGPGTGLGVAGLISGRRGGFRAVPGEGGHVTLPAMNDDEADLLASFLGTVAADLALIFWARGGVYLSGGVLLRLGPAFDKLTFRQRFETKGRFSASLAGIPTFIVTHSNAGLLGLTKIKP